MYMIVSVFNKFIVVRLFVLLTMLSLSLVFICAGPDVADVAQSSVVC